jgi:hypothetical protein
MFSQLCLNKQHFLYSLPCDANAMHQLRRTHRNRLTSDHRRSRSRPPFARAPRDLTP